MTRLFFFVFSLILFSLTACQKESILITNNTNCDGYCSYSVGSYWIYQHYRIDSNNVEQMMSMTDTVRITGDSVINGQTYFVMEGKIIPYASGAMGATGVLGYVRDSLHYLVNETGAILFSSQDFGSTLYQISDISPFDSSSIETHSFEMKDVVDSVTVPAGIFKVLNYEQVSTSTIPETQQIYDYKNRNQYYANGVGKVLQSYVFADKVVYERRLSAYHIQ